MEHIKVSTAKVMDDISHVRSRNIKPNVNINIYSGVAMIRAGVNMIRRQLSECDESVVSIEAGYVVRDVEAAIAMLERWSERESDRIGFVAEIEVLP